MCLSPILRAMMVLAVTHGFLPTHVHSEAPSPAEMTGGPEERPVPGRVFEKTSWTDVTLPDCVQRLARRAWVPMGLELRKEHLLRVDPVGDSREDRIRTNMPRFSIELKNATLQEVLDATVRKSPGYTWQVSRGVINILPKSVLGQEEYLLNRTIPHFKTINNRRADEVRMDMYHYTEESFGRGLDAMFGLWSGYEMPRTRHITIDMRNATVREILNEWVYLIGFAFWSYARDPWRADEKEYPEGAWIARIGTWSLSKTRPTGFLINRLGVAGAALNTGTSALIKDAKIELRRRLPRDAGLLYKAYDYSSDIYVKMRLIEVLASARDPNVLELMREAAKNDNPEMVAAVAGYLWYLLPDGLDLARELARRPEERIRSAAESVIKAYERAEQRKQQTSPSPRAD